MSALPQRNPHRKHNIGVLLIALSTATVLYLNYDPVPAGSLPNELTWAAADVPGFAEQEFDDGRAGSENSDGTNPLRGRMALLMQTLLLERGLQEMSAVSDYSATFVKQERIGGVLSEPKVLKVKVRQKPFSVYLKWLKGGDVGREVAYVDGENDNCMLVKFGGIKGHMIPTVKMSPTGDLATAEARYPITEMGIQQLIERILEYRYRDLELSQGVACRMLAEQQSKAKDCYCFEINYDSPDVCPKFRKSFIYINKASSLPVCVKNFGWPLDGAEELTGKPLDEATLLECYTFTDIATDDQLSPGAFELAGTHP